MTTYRGHCNHTMIHTILTKHKKYLHEHEKEALKALRTKIHTVTNGIRNIKVTIYLDDIDPVIIQEGAGDNELVININLKGDVDCVWVQKTFSQKMKDAFTSIVDEFVNAVIDGIKSIIQIGKDAIVGRVSLALEWKRD